MDETSVFLEVFGDYPINRVLDFLVVHEEFDYAMTDIASHAGVGYSTLKLFWGELEKAGVVRRTRAVGNAKMYQLDFGNPFVLKFREFYWSVTRARLIEVRKAETGRRVKTVAEKLNARGITPQMPAKEERQAIFEGFVKEVKERGPKEP